MTGDQNPTIAAVIIGRNEGERLVACLRSLGEDFNRVVYVDSGSTDDSVNTARIHGAEVVMLDTSVPFTAARARNAGIAALDADNAPDLVQFIDGDCVLDAGWISTASEFLVTEPTVAVVCGRRRERFLEASVYNRMCDAEWNTPVGQTRACGGDALMRWAALDAVGGYDATLIAGEEPELCLRLRRRGWKIWRLDAEMTLHDAAMTRFGQFWNRARRAGFAAAEAAAMYGKDPEQHGVAPRRRAAIWGLAIPFAVLVGVIVVGPVALWALMVYPLQIIRLALRDGGHRFAWEQAALLTIGKFAESHGILDYFWRRWRGGQVKLIEYK